MSPSDPSRTTRKRGSGMRSLAHGIEKVARRMVLGIADDRYTDTEPGGRRTFRDGLARVIRSLSVNVRTQLLQQRFYVRLAEDHNIIDGAQRADQGGTRSFGQDGAPSAFQGADARICVHANSQDIAFAARAFEIANVAHVQGIEAAVCQHNFLARPAMLRKEFPE